VWPDCGGRRILGNCAVALISTPSDRSLRFDTLLAGGIPFFVNEDSVPTQWMDW
jgi:hypothetical protein